MLKFQHSKILFGSIHKLLFTHFRRNDIEARDIYRFEPKYDLFFGIEMVSEKREQAKKKACRTNANCTVGKENLMN